ncbi:hypothetical protein AAHH80_35060, partial [Burkholderia pseudomallei]
FIQIYNNISTTSTRPPTFPTDKHIYIDKSQFRTTIVKSANENVLLKNPQILNAALTNHPSKSVYDHHPHYPNILLEARDLLAL